MASISAHDRYVAPNPSSPRTDKFLTGFHYSCKYLSRRKLMSSIFPNVLDSRPGSSMNTPSNLTMKCAPILFARIHAPIPLTAMQQVRYLWRLKFSFASALLVLCRYLPVVCTLVVLHSAYLDDFLSAQRYQFTLLLNSLRSYKRLEAVGE